MWLSRGLGKIQMCIGDRQHMEMSKVWGDGDIGSLAPGSDL